MNKETPISYNQWLTDNNLMDQYNTANSYLKSGSGMQQAYGAQELSRLKNNYNTYVSGINSNNTYLDGLAKGQAMNEQFLGQGAFDEAWANQRSSNNKEVLDRYRDQSRGLSAQENAAARAQFEGAIRRSGATARTALANSLAGRGMATGGYADSQRAAVEGALADQLIGAERQLLLDNVQAKREGLDSYNSALQGQESQVRDWLLNQFNIADAQGRQALEQEAAQRKYNLDMAKAKQRRRFLGIF